MKIKWGALVVDGRNKIGGQVASKNKAGAYMKNKVTPANPQTTSQTDVRSNLTTVSRAWSGLTAEQRAAWNAYAAQYPYQDIFGDSKYLSGFNMFMKCNLNLLAADESQITAPPATHEVTEVIWGIDTCEAPSTLDVNSATATAPANTRCIFLATPCLSPGRVPSKSDYRQIKSYDTWSGGALSLGTNYGIKFGNLVTGQNVGLGYYSLNTETGLVSQMRTETAIVG